MTNAPFYSKAHNLPLYAKSDDTPMAGDPDRCDCCGHDPTIYRLTPCSLDGVRCPSCSDDVLQPKYFTLTPYLNLDIPCSNLGSGSTKLIEVSGENDIVLLEQGRKQSSSGPGIPPGCVWWGPEESVTAILAFYAGDGCHGSPLQVGSYSGEWEYIVGISGLALLNLKLLSLPRGAQPISHYSLFHGQIGLGASYICTESKYFTSSSRHSTELTTGDIQVGDVEGSSSCPGGDPIYTDDDLSGDGPIVKLDDDVCYTLEAVGTAGADLVGVTVVSSHATCGDCCAP